MRKYYTRPCNFYYGNYAANLIRNKKAYSLAGNPKIAFDRVEIFQRSGKSLAKSKFYSISEIKKFDKKKSSIINLDLKNITKKRKQICGIKFNEPKIMGVLNITPDSFSDGGIFFNKEKAFDQANLMSKGGATIIDVGGESTRPGSKIVSENEEWNRIKETIINLRKSNPKIIISLDTRKSKIMKKGIENGVNIINDVSGLEFDKKSFDLINSKKIPFILHHMQGTPDTMQKNPKYNDAILDYLWFFWRKN